jgi:hypothetical protein
MKRFILAMSGLTTCIISLPAAAQMISPMLYEGPRIALQSHANRYTSTTGNTTTQPRGIAPVSASTKAVSPDTAALIFTPSASRRQANLSQFVAKSRSVDPKGADKMAALFASTDVIGMIDTRMRQTYGMRANNVADAYAVYWTSAWMGARGRSDDPTPGQMAMVRRQAAAILASTPEFVRAANGEKQEMAEALLVQAALIGDTVDTFKSDPAMLAKTKAAIRQGAKAMNFDTDAFRLTDEGFVPSAKTGAVRGRKGEATAYVLVAAAGCAGLGGMALLSRVVGKQG